MSETPSNDQGFAEAHPVLILIAILVLAATLRLVVLDKNPPGLFRDEARKAFSTWSLLTTGKDLTGRSWPLQVKELKAYTTPFYHWFSIPFFSTLGVSVFSTRLLAALAGSLACLFVFLLAKEWISVSAGCWSALLLAISPWHLLFSRWANQGILMTVFIPAAVWLTVRALREAGVKMWIHSVLAALLWALSWNAYEPSRLFAPLLFFAVMGIEGSRSIKSLLRLSGIGALTAIFLLPFLVDIWNNWAETQPSPVCADRQRASHSSVLFQELLFPLESAVPVPAWRPEPPPPCLRDGPAQPARNPRLPGWNLWAMEIIRKLAWVVDCLAGAGSRSGCDHPGKPPPCPADIDDNPRHFGSGWNWNPFHLTAHPASASETGPQWTRFGNTGTAASDNFSVLFCLSAEIRHALGERVSRGYPDCGDSTARKGYLRYFRADRVSRGHC
ncbi:MAG: glycosyltransferase family 39 protein [Candidatus Omnitrophica bacterium]|nr:glycosyltransferase family 39 protein [Candidatus Omnitrophota bacterium]